MAFPSLGQTAITLASLTPAKLLSGLTCIPFGARSVPSRFPSGLVPLGLQGPISRAAV